MYVGSWCLWATDGVTRCLVWMSLFSPIPVYPWILDCIWREKMWKNTVEQSLCLHCNGQGYSWGDFCHGHESPLRCHGKDFRAFQVDEDWGCGLHSPTTKQLAHQARCQFTPCHHRLTLLIGSGKHSMSEPTVWVHYCPNHTALGFTWWSNEVLAAKEKQD